VKWYLLRNRRHQGPFSLEELKLALSEGKIEARDFLITEDNVQLTKLDYLHVSDLIPDANIAAPADDRRLERKLEEAAEHVAADPIKPSGQTAFQSVDDLEFVPSTVRPHEEPSTRKLVPASTGLWDSFAWSELPGKFWSVPVLRFSGFTVAGLLVFGLGSRMFNHKTPEVGTETNVTQAWERKRGAPPDGAPRSPANSMQAEGGAPLVVPKPPEPIEMSIQPQEPPHSPLGDEVFIAPGPNDPPDDPENEPLPDSPRVETRKRGIANQNGDFQDGREPDVGPRSELPPNDERIGGQADEPEGPGGDI